MVNCIRVTGHGYVQEVNVDEFARLVIQDHSVAFTVLADLLHGTSGEYEWNEDEPEFYCVFTIVDEDALREQWTALRDELERGNA